MASLSASAQYPAVRAEYILENHRALVHGEGLQPFAVEGLKQQLDEMRIQRRNARKAPLKAVAPLLTTLWAQDSPYNRLLPSTGSFWGSSTLTGCVATSTAQVLNFFEYPKASIGKGRYSTDGKNYRSVSTATTFDWKNMADRYTLGYSEAQAKAVAELMRDCGYAASMIYTSSGSGTTAYDAGYGLVHNMQYDSLSLKVPTRMFYHDKDWKDMIYAELQAGRPVVYDAVDPSNGMGHSFVFDGMDAEGKVHVNWGWAGDANGYYDIDNLSPSYSDMYGQVYRYNFTGEARMIIGFKPQATPDPDEQYESFFAMQEKDSMWVGKDSVYLKQTPIFNFSNLCFNGLLGLVVEGEDGHGVVQPFFYSPWNQNAEIPYLGGLYPTECYFPSATLCDTDGKTPRPDGTYYLYLVSWAKQEMSGGLNPQYIRIPANCVGDDEENIGVWEAEIVGGHWDPKSFRRYKVKKEETAVMQVNADSRDNAKGTFDLSGRRADNDAKGLLIKNGKKVLVK